MMAEYGLSVDMVLWSVVDVVDMLTCLESQDRYVSVSSGYNFPCICYKLNNSVSNKRKQKIFIFHVNKLIKMINISNKLLMKLIIIINILDIILVARKVRSDFQEI